MSEVKMTINGEGAFNEPGRQLELSYDTQDITKLILRIYKKTDNGPYETLSIVLAGEDMADAWTFIGNIAEGWV